MSWGLELWDRVDAVIGQLGEDTDELSNVFTRFVKERGDLEKEYARGLRKLVARFTPKDRKKGAPPESSQTSCFRLLLCEVGYQAGQHELLSESLGKTVASEIKSKVKEVTKGTEQCKKEVKTLTGSLDKSLRSLEKARNQYAKCHTEWGQLREEVKRAEGDPTMARQDVEKVKGLAVAKQRQLEEYKATYAQQLVRGNAAQQDHYQRSLPAVLETLQALSVQRGEAVKEVLRACVKAERDVAPIIQRCQEEMSQQVEAIQPDEDTRLVIQKFKTGNVPPGDFPFEELPGSAPLISVSLARTSHQNAGNSSPNLFPRKQELERKVASHKAEIARGQKEVAGLQLIS